MPRNTPPSDLSSTPSSAPYGLERRVLLTGAVWSVPAIAFAAGAPASSASEAGGPNLELTNGAGYVDSWYSPDGLQLQSLTVGTGFSVTNLNSVPASTGFTARASWDARWATAVEWTEGSVPGPVTTVGNVSTQSASHPAPLAAGAEARLRVLPTQPSALTEMLPDLAPWKVEVLVSGDPDQTNNVLTWTAQIEDIRPWDATLSAEWGPHPVTIDGATYTYFFPRQVTITATGPNPIPVGSSIDYSFASQPTGFITAFDIANVTLDGVTRTGFLEEEEWATAPSKVWSTTDEVPVGATLTLDFVFFADAVAEEGVVTSLAYGYLRGGKQRVPREDIQFLAPRTSLAV